MSDKKKKSSPKKSPSKKTQAKKIPPKTGVKKTQTRKTPNKTKLKSSKNSLWSFFLILSLWGLLVGGVLVAWYGYDLPNVERLSKATRMPSVTFYADDGVKIASVGEYYDKGVYAEKLPKRVVYAFLATEDRRFFDHFGVDVFGIIRALARNFRSSGVVQGGSTITQQLAKNFLLTEGRFTYRDRSLRRKIQEVMLSLWLEAKFSKNQILTMYLNRVYFGAGAYGITAASKTYFGVQPYQLTVKQAALLAGLLKAPSKYSPFSNPDKSQQRTNVVLGAMLGAGFLRERHYQAALTAPIHLRELPEGSLFARYFIDHAMEEVANLQGPILKDLIVYTTLDRSLQKKVEIETKKILEEKGDAFNISQAAVVVMTPGGKVQALVGGSSYLRTQFNRATQAQRQTGSVFKLAVFCAALEKGLSIDRPVLDTAVKLGKWSPKNYGWKSRGQVSVRDAFAYSINTSTVRVAKYAGLPRIYEVATRLGVTADNPKDLTYALGTAETTLLQMTGAFAVFANDGRNTKPYLIKKIESRNGQLIYYRPAQSPISVVPYNVARDMKVLLKAVMDYGTGRKISLKGQECYGKSGTSQDYKDAWFIGFTGDRVCGVWMGNDDNASMKKVTGAKVPGHLWKAIMN
jgi:penicillin-binding protein 1A